MLATARLGGVNIHRGNGETTFGIAVHRMTAEADAGPVYLQK